MQEVVSAGHDNWTWKSSTVGIILQMEIVITAVRPEFFIKKKNSEGFFLQHDAFLCLFLLLQNDLSRNHSNSISSNKCPF